VRALLRTDCLPGPGVGGFGPCFLRLKFHKHIQSEASSAYEHGALATSSTTLELRLHLAKIPNCRRIEYHQSGLPSPTH
jgi:hypothetical protein